MVGNASQDWVLSACSLNTARNRGVIQPDLVIELERPRLNGERARSCPRLGGLVDDSYFDAESRQPEREHQPGWTGPGDQDRSVNAQTRLPQL